MVKKKRTIRKKKFGLISSLAKGALRLANLTLALPVGWIVYSHWAIDHNVPLPEAIPAGRRTFITRSAIQLNCYADTQAAGRPLVLIHSINAAASAYEMRPLFQHYRNQRPVYALDLPGYGLSERTSRVYSPQMFEDAVVDLLATQIEEPADVVALSLGSEFAALAARARPELVHSLTLISPTGFSLRGGANAVQEREASGAGDSVYSLISFPLWSRPLFDLIATRRSIRYFLGQSFIGPVPSDLEDYAYATAHQPGAEHVPLYFLSGKLFTLDVRSKVYEQVKSPTLVIYDQDPYTRFDLLQDFVERHEQWQAHRISPTLGLPHFERLAETVQVLNAFWQGLEQSPPEPSEG